MLSRFIGAQTTNGFDAAYHEALAYNRELGSTRGIDAVSKSHNLDAFVMPVWGYVATPAGLSDGPNQ